MANRIPQPGWTLPQAKFDFDFANKRYWLGRADIVSSVNNESYEDMLGGPGTATPGYAPNNYGVIEAFPTFAPRIATGLGLWCNRPSTNSALWCRDFTNAAWTKTNVTAAKNQVGADNINNAASSLTATAINATVLQTITLASAASIVSAYVKRLSGTGAISMTTDGTTWTDISGSINSTGYILVSIPAQTLANPVVGFQIATSGDSIAVDFFQQESGNAGAIPTSPLPTTSAAVQRFNEENFFGVIGGAKSAGLRVIREIMSSGGPWSMFAQYTGTPSIGAGWLISSDGGITIQGGCDGGAFTFVGSTTSNTGNAGLGNINKVAGRVNGFGSTCCMNGGQLATYNTTSSGKPLPPTTAFTHCGIINNGAANAAGPLDGYLSRLTFWNQEIPDGMMIELTR